MPDTLYKPNIENAEISAKNLRVHKDLHMPPASSVFELPSKKYSLDAHKIIHVDLRDEAVMWDLNKFRQLEKHTSWYKEEGVGSMPTTMFIVINAAQGEIIIYDARDMTAWMTFIRGGGYLIGSSSQISKDIKFLDGILYNTDNGSRSLLLIDFIKDEGHAYSTNGHTLLKGGIKNRNKSNTALIMSSSPAIVNAGVNNVAAIRNLLGKIDEFGRPKHIWQVGTAASGSWFIPNDDNGNIYDDNASLNVIGIALLSDGNSFETQVGATQDYVYRTKNVQSINSDSFDASTKGIWRNNRIGGQNLPWTNGAVFSSINTLENASIVNEGGPVLVIGSDEGLAISHTESGTGTNDLTFVMNATANWPPYSGVIGVSMAMEDATDLLGVTMTNNNAVTFSTTGIIGNCANFVAASSQSLTAADAAAHVPNTAALSVGCWFRREVDSGAGEGLIAKYDQDTASDRSFQLVFQGSVDRVDFSTTIVGPTTVSSRTPVGLSLDTWYHLVGTWDGAIQRLYLDGIEVDSDAQSGTLIDATENFAIGAISSTNVLSGFFDGQIDDVFVLGKALSADEVKFIYNRGKSALQSNVTTTDSLNSANITNVAVDQDSERIGVLDSSSRLTILDKYGIPYLSDISSVGTVDDIEVWTEPGSSEPSYAMAGSAAIKIVQKNANVYDTI